MYVSRIGFVLGSRRAATGVDVVSVATAVMKYKSLRISLGHFPMKMRVSATRSRLSDDLSDMTTDSDSLFVFDNSVNLFILFAMRGTFIGIKFPVYFPTA